MQNPLIIGAIVFGVIFLGAFVGWVIKQRLPKHHEQGFGGMVHISRQPMRQALNTLQTEREAELYE